MAYSSNDSGDDMLSDSASTDTSSQDAASSQSSTSDKTALVPTDFCPGMKPGDKFEVKVEEVQDGQYLLSYPEGGDESASEDASESPASERSTEADEYMA